MVLREIRHILDAWAPRDIAWEHDNVGLQVGSLNAEVRNILVALDVTDEVVAESLKYDINLILSHHPLLFHPLHSVDTDSRAGRLVAALIKHDINVYSAHTNLDFAEGGVSFALAAAIGLKDVGVLQTDRRIHKKISVFVPPEHVDQLIDAMSRSGAGTIGNYDRCSFRVAGVGTFRPNDRARPYKGRRGTNEQVAETRVEMIVPVWNLHRVIDAMLEAHPYEEVAYDIYDMANVSTLHGAGAIGLLPKTLPVEKFLRLLREKLHAPAIRYSGYGGKKIRRVAVCGGGGADLLPVAIERKTDAFVTGDVRFHKFQDADERILLVDAGHFETEQPIIPEIVRYLSRQFALRKENVKVMASRSSRNVVQYSYS